MDDAILGVLNAWLDGEWCWEREKRSTDNESAHMRNVILNHSDMFACHVRFILRDGEEGYKVGKGKLIGFYKMQLDIV